MRPQILTLLCCFFGLVLATGKLEDKSDIEDLLSAFNILTDEKKFNRFDEIFTPDVVYDPGQGNGQPVQGLPAIINIAKTGIPDIVASFSQLGTKLIKFVPPFDKEGRSDRAEAVSYNFDSFFSDASNSTGEPFFFLFIKYVDKEIVRTKDPGFGGWRIKSRSLELVGKPIGNLVNLENCAIIFSLFKIMP